jgi:hypothetical protein
MWASSQGSGTPDTEIIDLGTKVTLVGLAFQLGCFLIFFILVVWAHRHPANALRGDPGFRKLFAGLYLTIFFISVRNVFRLVEFTQRTVLGFPSPEGVYIIEDQEALFYAFDSLPIFLAFLSFIAFHPSRLLPTQVEAAEEPEEAKAAGGGGGGGGGDGAALKV